RQDSVILCFMPVWHDDRGAQDFFVAFMLSSPGVLELLIIIGGQECYRDWQESSMGKPMIAITYTGFATN
ncbi:MAG TPA: hypothetical protein VLL97_10620, partial [Acidobacteriota bacterium]|nr:hypothetical protein [Acidobacteriota bacterium]